MHPPTFLVGSRSSSKQNKYTKYTDNDKYSAYYEKLEEASSDSLSRSSSSASLLSDAATTSSRWKNRRTVRWIVGIFLGLSMLLTAHRLLRTTNRHTREGIQAQTMTSFIHQLDIQPPYSLSFRHHTSDQENNKVVQGSRERDEKDTFVQRPDSWSVVAQMAAEIEVMTSEWLSTNTPQCSVSNDRQSLAYPYISRHFSDNKTSESNELNEQDDPNGIFIALILYNNQEVLGTLLKELPKLIRQIGEDRVFVSIYENGSTDMTPQLLLLLAHKLRMMQVDFQIISKGASEPRGFGRDEPEQEQEQEDGEEVLLSGRVKSKHVKSSLQENEAKRHLSRVPRLAGLRNLVLEPLRESIPSTAEALDSFISTSEFPTLPPPNNLYKQVLFINDVHFCVDDVLELLYQQELQQADMSCGVDYFGNSLRRDITGLEFYDTWVARTINGRYMSTPETLGRIAALHPPSRDRFVENKPLQVFSCWNGITAINSKYFFLPSDRLYADTTSVAHSAQVGGDVGIKFRALNESDLASESYLFNVDLWKMNKLSRPNSDKGTKIMMVPRVKVAYTTADYQMIQADKEKVKHADREREALVIEDHLHEPSWNLVDYLEQQDKITDWITEPPEQVEFQEFNKMRGLFEAHTYRDWDDVY